VLFLKFPIIDSVFTCKQEGRIFVNDLVKPTVYFIIHKSNFAFSYCEIATENNFNQLKELFLKESKIPKYFHLYDASNYLIKYLTETPEFNIVVRERMRMKGKFIDFKEDEIEKPYSIKNISKIKLSDLEKLKITNVLNFWKSLNEFKNNAIGYVIFDEDKPCSIWYTLSISDNNCETDIYTIDEYRGKGLASYLGHKILNKLNDSKITMDWDVFCDNIPSIKIAEKYHYKTYFKYKFLSVYNKMKQ